MAQILECVPNFSEGQNVKVIESLSNIISSVENVKLLDIDAGFHANRTVFTFAGEPKAVIEAAFLAIKEASEKIDMRTHKGTHPRIGACDVCPLIPIAGLNMAEAIEYSNLLAKRIAAELDIPVYLYENSSQKPERKNLAWIRQGEYENLEEKIKKADFVPDFGKPMFNPKSGICTVGARSFLIAYNVNLATKDVAVAKKIAALVREKSENGLQKVKAIGWYIEEFDRVQVSTNITDYTVTSVFTVFEAIKKLANEFNTSVTGSELVGMIPLEALRQSGEQAMNLSHQNQTKTPKELAIFGANYLNLNEVKPFIAEEKVIEWALNL